MPCARLPASSCVSWPPAAWTCVPRSRRRSRGWCGASSQRPHPVLQQVQAGLAGLLEVELGARQRPVLDGGDEPGAVVGRRDQRCRTPIAPSAGGRSQESAAYEVDGRTSGRRPRRTRHCLAGPRRCSSPCAGRRRPAAGDRTGPFAHPATGSRLGSSDRRRAPACPRTPRGPVAPGRRTSMSRGPSIALSPAMHAWKLPTRERRARHNRRPGPGPR